MIGQTISHYHVLERLGGGGMGVVYRARDERLRREVALKFLGDQITHDDVAVDRFLHEAQAASALNHPNIITIYDVGESPAGRFLVMELVAGRTLRAVIAERPSSDEIIHLGHAMAASATYRVTVAWTTNRVTGARRRLRNTGSSDDRPDDSARSDVTVVGQSGPCSVVRSGAARSASISGLSR